MRFLNVAYADEVSSTPDMSSTSTDGASTTPLVSSSVEGVPVSPQPTAITLNTSAFQNIVLPPSKPGDVIAIVYSTDGVTWQPLTDINKDNWQMARYPIPIASWEELKHLQIAFIGLGDPNSPKVFLDAAGIEVSYDDPPQGTTNIIPAGSAAGGSGSSGATSSLPDAASSSARSVAADAPVISAAAALRQVFDPVAGQQCAVSPFSGSARRGGSTSFLLKLIPPASTTAPIFDAYLGSLPDGVSARVIPGVGGSDTIGVDVSTAAVQGSYTIVVVYKERASDGTVLPNFCQFNLVIN